MADGIQIDTRDLTRFQLRMQALALVYPKEMDTVIGAWAKDTRKVLKSTPYPAMRSGQTTVRTGLLANKWAVERNGARRYSIVNRAGESFGNMYAGYVVGKRQAWMHVGRWWRAIDVIKGQMGKLRTKVLQHTRQLWRRS